VTVVVANGFSCKTQIEQAGTGRGAMAAAVTVAAAAAGGGLSAAARSWR
jgi:hypothetical protein